MKYSYSIVILSRIKSIGRGIESNKNALCSLEKIGMIPCKWETSKWKHKILAIDCSAWLKFFKINFSDCWVLKRLSTWDWSMKRHTQLHTRLLIVETLLCLYLFYQLTVFSPILHVYSKLLKAVHLFNAVFILFLFCLQYERPNKETWNFWSGESVFAF